ncbi:MAG: KH domain-containing protein [Verrucomicrobia bacterium]|nr:KH domain-containing protein [Verrucomicrobiota bacterium]
MQRFLEFAVKGLVAHPEEVTVTPVEQSGLTIYELRMNPSDVGKVIGKQGKTIHTLRALLQAGSAKKSLRCSLEIIEDRPAS